MFQSRNVMVLALGLLTRLTLVQPSQTFAHSGQSVVAPSVAQPPVFDGTGQFPRGCDATSDTGYHNGAQVKVDARVSVFIAHTVSDVFFCFSGVETRSNESVTSPSPNTTASVYFDLNHAG